MPQLIAIETRYKGCRMRSRLEARWAVFFDSLGLEWEYEPEGFETSAGRYLPDFKIGDAWVEVKPEVSTISADEFARIQAFSEVIEAPVLLLVGTPQMQMYPSIFGRGTLADIVAHRPAEWGSMFLPREKRVWWEDPHDTFFKHICTLADRQALANAVLAAKGARFERGKHHG